MGGGDHRGVNHRGRGGGIVGVAIYGVTGGYRVAR